jgi:hypothetical protein
VEQNITSLWPFLRIETSIIIDESMDPTV